MKNHEMLQYLNAIKLMKNTTGSVTVTTPNGSIVLAKACTTYPIASTREEVIALLAYPTNLKSLLASKLVSLVF